MRISVLFVILTLCVFVNGFATFLQPFALSIGAALAVLNLDADLIPINLFSDKWKYTEEEINNDPEIK